MIQFPQWAMPCWVNHTNESPLDTLAPCSHMHDALSCYNQLLQAETDEGRRTSTPAPAEHIVAAECVAAASAAACCCLNLLWVR
jgi:hypothetical protein